MDKIYANALICQGGKIIEGSLAVKDGFIDEIIPAGGVLPVGGTRFPFTIGKSSGRV